MEARGGIEEGCKDTREGWDRMDLRDRDRDGM